jgi:hypothetical protein
MPEEDLWPTDRLWRLLAGTAVLTAILAWGFASSEALLPLRVVAEFPAELGRALGAALSGGHPELPRLMPASGRSIGEGDRGRFLMGALGLLLGLAASALCLWLARSPIRARWATRVLGGALLIASLFPPYGMFESLPALVAGVILLGIGVLGPALASSQALLLGAAWSGLAPLWQMEGPLFRSGRPGPDLDGLSQATGQPALLWSIVGAGLCALAWWWLLRPPSAPPRVAAAPPAT